LGRADVQGIMATSSSTQIAYTAEQNFNIGNRGRTFSSFRDEIDFRTTPEKYAKFYANEPDPYFQGKWAESLASLFFGARDWPVERA
jgi:hypothetical protein